jgi:hypothetical protein
MNSKKNIRIIATILFAVSFLVTLVTGNERLYVFYPSTFDYQSMQNKMDSATPGVSITVFSRYDDFALKMKSEPPEAVITKPLLIQEQFNDYEVILNGVRNGKTEGNYVVLSIDSNFTSKSITNESIIGIIDILGRTGMKTFVNRQFSMEPKIKRVSRIGDLLPFLSFDIAAGIMIESVFIDYFRSTSQLQFTEAPLPESTTGVIAFAVKKGKLADKSLSSLKQNKKNICELFYIQQWK